MATNANVKSVLESAIPVLNFSFGTKEVPSGTYAPRGEVASAPTLSWPGGAADSTKKYVHLNIDLDAPFISFSFMSPILHSIWTDLTLSPDGTLKHAATGTADWIKPRPPPGAAPHRYVSLLYEQPEGINADGTTVPGGNLPRSKRIKFDLEGFEKKAGLGKPVAGGYFTSN